MSALTSITRLSGVTARPTFCTHRSLARATRSLSCRVSSSQEPDTARSPVIPFEELSKRASSVVEKYDFLSAGVGALAVTAVCVSKGQSPITALWITAASTVIALLVNDFFEDS